MRKKFIAITGVVMIAALIVAAVVGCGSKSGSSSVGDPLAFFNQAKGQLKAATSFSLQGQIGVKFNGTSDESSLLPSNINVPFDGAVQKTGNVPDAKLSFDTSFISNMLGGLTGSSGMSSTMDVYLVQGKIYFQSPLDGAWYYSDTTSIPGLPSFITSQDYAQLLDAAKDVTLVQEISSSMKYEVSLDVNKLFPGDLSQLFGSLPQGEITPEQLQSMVDQLKQSISNTKMNVTVDKASGNPTEIAFTLDLSLQGLGDLTGGLVDMGTGVTVSFDANFADYGQKQDINLPSAAKNAKPAEDMMSGSLPNL